MSDSAHGRTLRFDVEVPTCREGVFVPCGYATPEQVIGCIQHAERLGYHAVWATDFVTPSRESGVRDGEQPSWLEPMTTLAFAAAETERVRLGTGVLVLPYRDPVILAKQAATLDRLSGGRFLLGLGLGAWKSEFAAVAAWRGRAHRGRMSGEFTELLRRLLNDLDEPVSHRGRYVSVEGLRLHPRPLQRPLPFYMLGRNDDALARVARFGDGLMAAAPIAAERKAALAALLAPLGRSIREFDVLAEGELRLARSHEQAAREYRASRIGHYRASRGADLDAVIAPNWIGTPQQVAEKIALVAEQGIDHFNVLHIVGDTLEERMTQMQWFMEDVASQLA